MVKKSYVPRRGDIVLLSFSPQQGREQKGRRPALVISDREYNALSGLAVVCPVTSVVKGYPFEFLLPQVLKTKGVVLLDQIKSLDWQHRDVAYIEHLPGKNMEDAFVLLSVFIQG